MRFPGTTYALAIALAGWSFGCGGGARGPSAPSAASPIGDGSAQPPQQQARCDARAAAGAIGERATRTLLERARVAAGAQTARFLRPGEAVTMEFASGRLNLELDRRDIVVAVRCG